MAARHLNKRQLKRELDAVRPYSRSRIAQALRLDAELQRRIAAGGLEWLMPKLPSPWQDWARQLLQSETVAVTETLGSSSVLGMDIPLLQRFSEEASESDNLYVHSLNDAAALVFSDAGHCVMASLHQGQISEWQACPDQPTEFETQLRAVDAVALHAAWQRFADEMNCAANLSQFSAAVFDAGLQSQRLVCISPITLDWMDHYGNIHTNCHWFNGVSRLMDGAEIVQTMGHGRD
jgi:hypothetical protein